VETIFPIRGELVFEADERAADRAAQQVKEIMERVADFRVPLAVDVTAGWHWGEIQGWRASLWKGSSRFSPTPSTEPASRSGRLLRRWLDKQYSIWPGLEPSIRSDDVNNGNATHVEPPWQALCSVSQSG